MTENIFTELDTQRSLVPTFHDVESNVMVLETCDQVYVKKLETLETKTNPMLIKIAYVLLLSYTVVGSSLLGPISVKIPAKKIFIKLSWRF